MDILLGFFIGILVIGAIVILVVFYYLRKGFRFVKRMVRGEMTDEEFERLSKKHHRRNDGPSFDKDYFKGTNRQQSQQQQQSSQRRTTRTAEGFTIVDRRDPNKASKKIFAPDEGEYVEFTEE